LKVDRLDARHCEGDGLDGVGRQAISSCKFHVFHVQNVFGQEGEALVKAVRTIWRQREQMRRVQGHFKGCHCALTLIDTTKFEKVSCVRPGRVTAEKIIHLLCWSGKECWSLGRNVESKWRGSHPPRGCARIQGCSRGS
jgi:hypothetical protein